MRRASIGIDEVASRETLLEAFASAALAKTGRYAVEVFRANLEERMRDLQSELLSGIYQPDPMRAFSIRDPKPRMIHAPSFRDRVVHHALMRHMGPELDKRLIYHSYACRKEKGTHRAVLRAARNARRGAWVLHLDIAKYFASIDHDIALAQDCAT